MKDQEAVKIIQNRIGEMVSNPHVQNILTEKRNSGLTKNECRDWLAKAAIATLYGEVK